MWNRNLEFALFFKMRPLPVPNPTCLLYWTILSNPTPYWALLSSQALTCYCCTAISISGWLARPTSNQPPRSRHRIKAYHSSNLHLSFLLPSSSFVFFLILLRCHIHILFIYFSLSSLLLLVHLYLQVYSSSFLFIFKFLAESFHPAGSFVWCSKSFLDDT